jgi:hypothetical protein
MERYIVPEIGRRRIDEVTTVDIERIRRSLRRTPYQAHRVVAVAATMFGTVLPPEKNPCRGVGRFKEDKRERILSADELARLGNAPSAAKEDGSEMPSVITACRLLILYWRARAGGHDGKVGLR